MMNTKNNSLFRRTQHIPELGLFYKEVGRLWRVSDCEEFSGSYSQEMMGLDYCFVPDELYLTRKMS